MNFLITTYEGFATECLYTAKNKTFLMEYVKYMAFQTFTSFITLYIKQLNLAWQRWLTGFENQINRLRSENGRLMKLAKCKMRNYVIVQ